MSFMKRSNLILVRPKNIKQFYFFFLFVDLPRCDFYLFGLLTKFPYLIFFSFEKVLFSMGLPRVPLFVTYDTYLLYFFSKIILVKLNEAQDLMKELHINSTHFFSLYLH